VFHTRQPTTLAYTLKKRQIALFISRSSLDLTNCFESTLSSEKSPTITLTAEEADKVKDACKGIFLNYKKPMTGFISSLEILSLQRAATTGNVVPFASQPISVHRYYIHQFHDFQEPLANLVNFDFVIWFNTQRSSFEYPKVIQIDNKRPHPVLCKDLSLQSLHQVSSRAITNYIAHCYQDWIKVGGIQCAEDDFWIDLWSEEAFRVYKDPFSDPHSQVQLVRIQVSSEAS
jgi:hypothetical protein